jgi:hypothetical protein
MRVIPPRTPGSCRDTGALWAMLRERAMLCTVFNDSSADNTCMAVLLVLPGAVNNHALLNTGWQIKSYSCHQNSVWTEPCPQRSRLCVSVSAATLALLAPPLAGWIATTCNRVNIAATFSAPALTIQVRRLLCLLAPTCPFSGRRCVQTSGCDVLCIVQKTWQDAPRQNGPLVLQI